MVGAALGGSEVKFCARCGGPRGAGAQFCARCGASFAAPMSSGPSTPQSAVPAPPDLSPEQMVSFGNQVFSQIESVDMQIHTYIHSGSVLGTSRRHKEALPMIQQKSDMCDSLRAVAGGLAEREVAAPPEWDKHLFGTTGQQRLRADSVLEQRHAELLALDATNKRASDNEVALAKRVEATFQSELRKLSRDDARSESEFKKFEWKALVYAFGGQFNMPNDLRAEYSRWIERGTKSGISDAASGATFEQAAAARVLEQLQTDLSGPDVPSEWKLGNWRLRQEYVRAVAAQRAHRAAQARADHARIKQLDDRIRKVGPDTRQALNARGAQAGAQLRGLTREIGDSLHRRKLFNELRSIAILRRVELLSHPK